MSERYEGPITSASDFSAGLLSGNLPSGPEKLEEVKSNLSFRLNSAREMIVGMGSSEAMSPLERRMQIRERRLNLLGLGSEDKSGASGDDGSNRSSISDPRRRSSSGGTGSTDSSSDSSPSGSPLMSEVDKGTKARATDQGFGN